LELKDEKEDGIWKDGAEGWHEPRLLLHTDHETISLQSRREGELDANRLSSCRASESVFRGFCGQFSAISGWNPVQIADAAIRLMG
jgi:hypothetical protein